MKHLRPMRFLASIAVLCLASDVSAEEQEVVFYKEVAGWHVYADRTNGNACFTATIYEGGTILRIGLNGPGSNLAAFVAFGNENWRSIEVGKDYDVTIQMDRETPWKATASGWAIGDVPFLVVNTDKAGFFSEFVRKHGIVLAYEGKEIARLSLKGSAAAARAVIECQELMRGLDTVPPPAVSDDPFANPSSPSPGEDPFA